MNGTAVRTIPILYFSDMLCIWAYFAHIRVDAIQANYGAQVSLEHRFCSVFADTQRKISAAGRGGDADLQFNAHLPEAAARFPEIKFNPDIWISARPASSTSIHLFLKAAQLAAATGSLGASAA